MLTFQKRLSGLYSRHPLLVEFHKLGNTGAFAGSGSSALGEPVSVHNGTVVVLMGFAQFFWHKVFIV